MTLPLLLGLAVLGCDQDDVPSDGDGESDSESDSDTNDTDTNDTSEDTDSETDTDTGGDGDHLYVDIDAPPGGDGLSWATARNDLRAAVEELAGSGGIVWVAEGIYTPPDDGVVLRVGPGVSLYGGFAGDESDLSERDHLAHPTILQQTHADPAVVEIVDFTADTPPILLDGVVVTGDPNTPVEQRGRGIAVLDQVADQVPQPQVQLHNLEIHGTSNGLHVPGWATLELHNASIHDNVGDQGPAIYQGQSRLLVHDSKIFANQSTGAGAIEHSYDWDFSYFGAIELWSSEITGNIGGGINGATVKLYDCLIEANTGGTAARATLGLTAEDTEFIDNTDGAAWAEYGSVKGSRFIDNDGFGLVACSTFTVTDSLFVNNTGTLGGAIRGLVIEFSCFAEIHISNSKFIGNSAERGGAIYGASEFWVGSAEIDVVNSQFVGNQADEGGAIFGSARVEASSFADNLAAFGPAVSGVLLEGPTEEDNVPVAAELHACVLWPDEVDDTFIHSVSNSCFPAGMPFGDDGGNAELLADPFVRADLDNDGYEELYLDPLSPCVDRGGSVEGLDWSAMTTQDSQCTDSGLLDAGAHYTPLEDAGVCG